MGQQRLRFFLQIWKGSVARLICGTFRENSLKCSFIALGKIAWHVQVWRRHTLQHLGAYSFRIALEISDRGALSLLAPALAGVGDPIQAYCDLLEVRWLLSEQAKQDVGEDAALEALARRAVPAGSAAEMAIADVSTGQLPALTPAMLTEIETSD